MERIETENVVGERFETLYELYQFSETRPVADEWVGRTGCEKETHDAGSHRMTPEESKQAILYGTDIFDDEFSIIKNEVDNQVRDYFKAVRTHRTKRDVVGGSVMVERALLGYPKAFNRRVPDRRPKKTVEIFFGLSTPWHVSASSRLRNACIIMAIAEKLEVEGYAVAITIFPTCSSNDGNSKIHLAEVKLKNYNTPFNLRKVQYPMAAKASLFHMGKLWLHHFPGSKFLYGEGTSADYGGRQKDVKAYCKARGGIYMSNNIMNDELNSANGVSEVFEYVEKEIRELSVNN